MAAVKGSTGIQGRGFNPPLKDFCREVSGGIDRMEGERVAILKDIGNYIVKARQDHGRADLLMVCTHNSRRSHLAQLWLQTAGYFYGLENLHTFSGGTVSTAANIRIMRALQRAGFTVVTDDKIEKNQHYTVIQGFGFRANTVFSKVFDDDVNPGTGFGAVMVCSEADKNCPFIPGAEERFSLPYVDPKHADGSPGEQSAYDLASHSIAREMFYIAQYAKERPS